MVILALKKVFDKSRFYYYALNKSTSSLKIQQGKTMLMQSRLAITKLDSGDENEGQLYYNSNRNFIALSGFISWKIADGFFDKLSEFEDKRPQKPIKVYINSHGGEGDAMFKIYDHIRNSPCPIITIGNGLIYSAAMIIFLAGDLRMAFPNAAFRFHWPMRHPEHQNPDEAKESADWHNKLFKILIDIAKDRTKISNRGTLRKLFRTAKRFNAETAVKYGVAHQILEPAKKQVPKSWAKLIKP